MSEHQTPHDAGTSPVRTPHFVITAEGELYGEESEENQELARRITACVNACDGITTEELEAGIVGQMRQVIADVLPILQDRSDQTVSTTEADGR